MIQHFLIDRARLELAWGQETMMNPESYDPAKPSKNQCAVTALLVQELLGGEIVRALATLPNGTTDSHYFNVVEGRVIDFTRDQFPEGTTIPPGEPRHPGFSNTREYLLSNEDTANRYKALKRRYLQACRELPGTPGENAGSVLMRQA